MKRTLITAAVLAALAGTQAFAQNTKEGVITFALTASEQLSVSTSPTALNAGLWSSGPQYYKTQTIKKTTTHVLQAISQVLYKTGGRFSSRAQLVLVQGELGGFFNVGDILGGDVDTDLAWGDPNDGFSDSGGLLSTQEDLWARLATGRHFRANPINGLWPVGHHQPWGQIFVKDPAAAGHSAIDPLCVNVTFFFGLTVQECYDCLFLNSFISDAKFAYKSNASSGPPCCGVPTDLTGNGKDKYFLTLSFDNTINNPYLDKWNDAWIGKGTDSPWWAATTASEIVGMGTYGGLPGDGINPDIIGYVDVIKSSGVTGQRFVPNVLRFTLHGILTYNWTLKKINSSDLYYDFVGTASYAANGYGFADLLCSLFTGSASISEKITKASNCCLDLPWYDATVSAGSSGGWYGIGWNLFQDQYPLNTAANGSDDYLYQAEGWYFASPINTSADISLHVGYNEWYEARWQFPTYSTAQTIVGDNPAQPESLIDTPFATGILDSPYRQTRIPSARSWTNRGNTDWPGTGGDSPTYNATP